MESSTKIMIRNLYRLVLMVSTILKMKNLHSSTASHYIVRNKKMFGRPFCFPIGICSYSFFLELSMAHLLKKVQDFIICLSRDIDILTHPEYKKIEKIVHDSVATCTHP
jgi:hypothetical protein